MSKFSLVWLLITAVCDRFSSCSKIFIQHDLPRGHSDFEDFHRVSAEKKGKGPGGFKTNVEVESLWLQKRFTRPERLPTT